MSGPVEDFLLEIGCEEIPARMLWGAASDLGSRTASVLDAAGLEHGSVHPLCTPRRLAVRVQSVAVRQAARDEEVTGPPAKAAFGPDGEPTKAALGFARKMGVTVSALATIPTPKGDYLGVRRHVPGRATADLLAEELPRAIAGMTFPKTMRWGDGTRRFVRPVHWVVALLGAEIVPLELFGVRAGRESSGHRVLGRRTIAIAAPAAYEEALGAEGIAVDREARRRAVSRKLVELSGGEGLRAVEDAELLEEAADLVEHPGAVLGGFPTEFLRLPREILVTTLRHHQKAFTTETDEGLASHFLVVADTDSDPEGHIRRGNEWVVVGRLEDARFFYQEDRKVPLATRTEKLAQVTFHAKGGSYADKSRRIEEIAVALAQRIDAARKGPAGTRAARTETAGKASGVTAPRAGIGAGEGKPQTAAGLDRGATGSWADLEVLRHAARLAKCDLTTGLVGEFPELQGIAGGLYLAAETESGGAAHPRGCAEAIYDQYRPAGARDDLPRTREGLLLALSDRLDSLAVLARCVGLPTGRGDPFGLRRSAYGAVRIVVESALPLSLEDLVASSWAVAGAPLETAGQGVQRRDLTAFLRERFEFWLKEDRGVGYDTVQAVLLARGFEEGSLPRVAEKAVALQASRDLPDFAALIEIHKRCRNILQQAGYAEPAGAPPSGGPASGAPAAETLWRPQERQEGTRFEAQIEASEQTVRALMEADDFETALHELARIRPALSSFFDAILIMDPDPVLRNHRLGLVARVRGLIEMVADLHQISISREALQKLTGQPSRSAP